MDKRKTRQMNIPKDDLVKNIITVLAVMGVMFFGLHIGLNC